MLGDGKAIRTLGMIHGILFCIYTVSFFIKQWNLQNSLSKSIPYFSNITHPYCPIPHRAMVQA